MGVSKNRGTPKWMVYNGKPYQNGWFGSTPIFGSTHIFSLFQKHHQKDTKTYRPGECKECSKPCGARRGTKPNRSRWADFRWAETLLTNEARSLQSHLSGRETQRELLGDLLGNSIETQNQNQKIGEKTQSSMNEDVFFKKKKSGPVKNRGLSIFLNASLMFRWCFASFFPKRHLVILDPSARPLFSIRWSRSKRLGPFPFSMFFFPKIWCGISNGWDVVDLLKVSVACGVI